MESMVVMHDLEQLYRDKKVFVTGHTGFKGSWLTAWLHTYGAKIKGYALPPEYENGIFNFFKSLRISEDVFADIRDKGKLKKEIESFQPDYIFHLAAQPLVRMSYEKPAETFEVNAIGTANLLEAVVQLKNKCVITVITTDKVYENKEQNILYKEEDRLGGYDPYSASKACTELVINSFRNSFFNPQKFTQHQKSLVSVRAGNVIGGGDWNKDRIIPDIVRSLQSEKIIEVRNPDAIRPWQHVLEPISGYLALAASLFQSSVVKYSPAYNFGPVADDHITVRELVELAIANWGKGDWKDASFPGQLHEANLLMLDITKAEKELNWHPKLNSEEAVKWTIDWYKKIEKDKIDFTFQQIKDYISL